MGELGNSPDLKETGEKNNNYSLDQLFPIITQALVNPESRYNWDAPADATESGTGTLAGKEGEKILSQILGEQLDHNKWDTLSVSKVQAAKKIILESNPELKSALEQSMQELERTDKIKYAETTKDFYDEEALYKKLVEKLAGKSNFNVPIKEIEINQEVNTSE